jgi:hypothetical protein
MKSPEKVLAALEFLADADDQEIRETFPINISPSIVRMGVGGMVDQVPQDPAELDEFLTNVANFCLAMRSDDYAVAA